MRNTVKRIVVSVMTLAFLFASNTSMVEAKES